MRTIMRTSLVLMACLSLALCAWGCDSDSDGNGTGGGTDGGAGDSGGEPDASGGDTTPSPDGGTPCAPTPITVDLPADVDASCVFTADLNVFAVEFLLRVGIGEL